MFALSRFRVDPGDESALRAEAADALRVLASRPGFVAGHLGRATDEPGSWLLVTEWTGVGDYRRALSSYDVKVRTTGLFLRAEQEPGAFEVLESMRPTAVTSDGPAEGAGS
jgi:quinol monooxygenase YgiN